MGNYIPLDVIENHILIWLPERSVARCKCVCKQWLQVLSGSEFRRIHLQHQTKDNRHHRRIICGPLKDRYKTDYKCYDVKRNETLRACGGVFYALDLDSPSVPMLYRLPGFRVLDIKNCRLGQTIGYSNGVLCMDVRNTAKGRWPHVFFGNPLTGCYEILSDPLVNGPFIVGFGYDSSADDYKFVTVDKTTRHPHVYSLKSKSWTVNRQTSDEQKIELGCCTPLMDHMIIGTFVESSLYWFSNEGQRLIRFDLEDERFSEVPLPRDWDREYGYTTLKVFEGSLCMIKTAHRMSYWTDVCMWLMKKESNEFSWIKLIKLHNLAARCIYPLAFTDGGVLCCVEHEQAQCKGMRLKSQYALVDPNTSTCQYLEISGMYDGLLEDFVFRSHFPGYIDSLV